MTSHMVFLTSRPPWLRLPGIHAVQPGLWKPLDFGLFDCCSERFCQQGNLVCCHPQDRRLFNVTSCTFASRVPSRITHRPGHDSGLLSCSGIVGLAISYLTTSAYTAAAA